MPTPVNLPHPFQVWKKPSEVLIDLINKANYQQFGPTQLLITNPTTITGAHNTSADVAPNPTPGGSVPVTKWKGPTTIKYNRVNIAQVVTDLQTKGLIPAGGNYPAVLTSAQQATVSKYSDLLPYINAPALIYIDASDIVDGPVDISTAAQGSPETVTLTIAAGSLAYTGSLQVNVTISGGAV